MSVDLANVNISLQQFQDISSGKYNAGEVKLASAKSGSFNILSTDPGLHLDGDLALDTLRMQSFFVAPRNAAAH